jgi:dihydroneopterin aldolase
MIWNDTDYVLLNKIVVEEMDIRSQLLEHVGHRIPTRIFSEVPEISRILLGVSKLNPPIGDVESVTIEGRIQKLILYYVLICCRK